MTAQPYHNPDSTGCLAVATVHRDLAVQALLTLLILLAGYLVFSYHPTQLKPPSEAIAEAGILEPGDDPAPPVPTPSPDRYNFIARSPIFTTIIDPPPPPTPTKPTPTPPPKLRDMMAPYRLVFMDPPRSVTLHRQGTPSPFEWPIGQTRKINTNGRQLDVTLKSIDGNSYRVTFTAPGNAPLVYRFFE